MDILVCYGIFFKDIENASKQEVKNKDESSKTDAKETGESKDELWLNFDQNRKRELVIVIFNK